MHFRAGIESGEESTSPVPLGIGGNGFTGENTVIGRTAQNRQLDVGVSATALDVVADGVSAPRVADEDHLFLAGLEQDPGDVTRQLGRLVGGGAAIRLVQIVRIG